MSEVGRNTILDDDVFLKIKKLALEGKNLKEMAELSGICEDTLYNWHAKNYLNFYDKVEGWRRDRKLMLANRNIEAILQLDTNDKDFVKTVSDMSKFVAETLDKKNYSKRNELTGADGKDLQPVLVKFIDDSTQNNNNTEGVSEVI